ncbi:MAG: crotonase/enoyl-CoA hydratase family protein [Xanthobacteraceae bacterium]|nr:crotonase/enoyl-CoA hydratase family protein [Xanthobacteraceae bacterium]
MSDVKPPGRVHAGAEGRILRITIDNVARRNAFSPEMMRELSDALTWLDRDDALWAGVIVAEGEHFTAGLDMPKFFGPDATDRPLPADNVDPFGLTRRCSKPLVIAVQGITYTLGIELLLACDIAIAADTARFSQLEAKRGIAPLGGAHFRFLQRMGWGDAMYHLMLCDEFDAARALKIGLVQEVVPAGREAARALEIAEAIARNAPLGVQVTKAGALTYLREGEQAAIDFIATMRARVLGSEDAQEGIRSFIERRPGVFRGR